MSVETGADQDQFWLDPVGELRDFFAEAIHDLVRRCAIGQGEVLCQTQAPPTSSLLSTAGSRIKRPAVHRKEANRRIFPEDRLRAIAVVNVPIDDQNTMESVVLYRVPGAYGDMIDEAEAHGAIGKRVVAWRP